MTLPMARDLGKYGIRVVTIAPGVKYIIFLDNIYSYVWINLRKNKIIINNISSIK